jgi:hypothetical protein
MRVDIIQDAIIYKCKCLGFTPFRVLYPALPVHLAFITLSEGEIYVTDLAFMCVCSKGLARIAMAASTCAVHLMAVA